MSEHPAADLLELFALRRLTASQTWEILLHLDDCANCRAALRIENDFIAAIRAALRDLQP